MNNFEKWKQDLTIEKLQGMLCHSCMECPLRDRCQETKFRMSKSCNALLKEWGEQEES